MPLQNDSRHEIYKVIGGLSLRRLFRKLAFRQLSAHRQIFRGGQSRADFKEKNIADRQSFNNADNDQ